MNRPFDFDRYLADAAGKRMTMTRLFVLCRQLQTPAHRAGYPRGFALPGFPPDD